MPSLSRCIQGLVCFLALLGTNTHTYAQFNRQTDLLIVGGNEAAIAAAIQAVRMGINDITILPDIPMLGGQFSAEAVGAIDEWTIVNGKRVNFARSGIFLEAIDRFRTHNERLFGIATPGNAVTATDTVEPAIAAQTFARWLKLSQITVESPRRIASMRIDATGVLVEYAQLTPGKYAGRQGAKLVIDCTDWGDVIRLAGAEYFAGPDPRSRFGEPSAPDERTDANRNEMNPISYCMVLREGEVPAVIDKPPHYDERRYFGATNATREQFTALGWPKGVLYLNTPPFVDSFYPEGIYSKNQSVYTQRRLVDRYHNNLPIGSECVLLNWVTQDYPLYNFPQWVVDALERTETGASRKNIVEMSPHQRQIVFQDAKDHSLGMLYFLQNLPDKEVAEKFQRLYLVDDFGTSDKLPPKPYVREGLRLHALSMLREQDIRTPHNEPRWAKVMPHDGLFGFQFNIDFHPTRRQFLNDNPSAPWALIHTPTRNWSTHTDRAMLSARSLVPIKTDRLIGCSKNIGLTSITSAALRLHGQMMLTGQAAGAMAAMCLKKRLKPRELVADGDLVDELQQQLVTSRDDNPGVLLWPYDDVPPNAPYSVGANLLAAWQILPALPDTVSFQPNRQLSRREVICALDRAVAALTRPHPNADQPLAIFDDLPENDPARLPAGRLFRGLGQEVGAQLKPNDVATCVDVNNWLKLLNLPQATTAELILTRSRFAQLLWNAIKDHSRWHPNDPDYLKPGHDADGDGIVDLEDPLPFDRDNDNVPDRIDPDLIKP